MIVRWFDLYKTYKYLMIFIITKVVMWRKYYPERI